MSKEKDMHTGCCYPSYEALEAIKNWKLAVKGSNEEFHKLMKFVKSLWTYRDSIKRRGEWYYLATCGWSGNESIIKELKNNEVFWLFFFDMEESGGGYVFRPYTCVTAENPFFRYIEDDEYASS